MRIDGVDAVLLDAQGVRGMYPFLDFDNAAVSRFAAGCCSRAAARCAMTRWLGVMRALRMLAASTSSKTAK